VPEHDKQARSGTLVGVRGFPTAAAGVSRGFTPSYPPPSLRDGAARHWNFHSTENSEAPFFSFKPLTATSLSDLLYFAFKLRLTIQGQAVMFRARVLANGGGAG